MMAASILAPHLVNKTQLCRLTWGCLMYHLMSSHVFSYSKTRPKSCLNVCVALHQGIDLLSFICKVTTCTESVSVAASARFSKIVTGEAGEQRPSCELSRHELLERDLPSDAL